MIYNDELNNLIICIKNFDGITKYLNNASACDEFSQTCCDEGEIGWTYGGPKPKPNKLS